MNLRPLSIVSILVAAPLLAPETAEADPEGDLKNGTASSASP